LLKFKKKVGNKMKDKIVDYIVLPLYSPKSGKVEECSGLNQWNAGGRQRNPDEVYINFPTWIHKVKKGFFEYNTEDNKTDSFDVKLPNGWCATCRSSGMPPKASVRRAASGWKVTMPGCAW